MSAPVYIVSKGRWEKKLRMTSRSLHAMGVAHFIIVEEQEAENYVREADDSATILVLDKKYQREYDTCDDLGDAKSKGPGPARNFAWAHALASGHAWHWVMDDNIAGFCRLNRNTKIKVTTGAIFDAMEHFMQRYENAVMGGPNYRFFANQRDVNVPAFISNTRIYSCNLIRNDIAFRWRGRYNEDTDLSLRILKSGLCTVQFNAFLQNKIRTQILKGGNTEEFYAKEGTRAKSEMQVRLHPDVSRLVWRFKRVHHYVDYSGFRTALRLKAGAKLRSAVDEFGMTLVTPKKGKR